MYLLCLQWKNPFLGIEEFAHLGSTLSLCYERENKILRGVIMLLKEEKTEIIEKNRTHENDTGSPEVQIAILTKRISDLTEPL